MASSAERLHFYRLYYHGLSAAQSQIPPCELHSREARLRQAELRMLEELIMLFVEITPNPTTTTAMKTKDATDSVSPTADMDSLDISLVTDILLLSPPSPWILYIVVRSETEWQLSYVSPSMKRLLGWRPNDVLGKPIWEGCHQEDVPILQQIFHPKGTATTSSLSSNSWTAANSYAYGDFVTFRRLRRNQSVACMSGTGIAIGSKWYAWVEQDTSALQVALLGSSAADCLTSNWPLTNPNARRPHKNGFQPPRIILDERGVEPEQPEGNDRNGFQHRTLVVEDRYEASQPDQRNNRKGFQPPTIVVGGGGAVPKLEEINQRKGFQPQTTGEERVLESKPQQGNQRKGFQPPTIGVEDRVLESKLEERNHRQRFQLPTYVDEGVVGMKPVEDNHKMSTIMKEIKTGHVPKPCSPSLLSKSKDIKGWKASAGHSSRRSSGESLPQPTNISPPLLPNQAQTLNTVNEKTLDLLTGKTVLLVDDSNTYLKGGQALLTRMGCRVFIAHDGEEALQMMQCVSPMADLPSQFDIVFMDLSMPKMDGIQAVKLFRIWEGNHLFGRARTLIIAATANDTEGGMVLCAQTGFDGFVTKPLNKKKILDCLVATHPLK